jgi:hypothetical protein
MRNDKTRRPEGQAGVSLDAYRRSVHQYGLWILTANLLLMLAAAAGFGSSLTVAAGLGVAFLAIPAALHLLRVNALVASIVQGVASMCFSALLIHLGHGMIEMHFHIFAMLAMMIVYGSPLPMIVAAAVIAVHHISFFFLFPNSLLNHHCPSFGIVLIHAGFVVAEVIPCAFIAWRFGRFITAQQLATGQLSASAADMADAARSVDEVNRAVRSFADAQTGSISDLLRANGTVRDISAENAGRAAGALEMTRVMSELVENGTRFLKQLTTAIVEFSETSGKVGRITRTIDEIAFQTNILALNAAVEAARAGESGAGFAVVADEVRALAQKSASAAKDTSGLIEASLDRANEGVSRLKNVGDVFDQIMTSCTQLKESVADVNGSSEKQVSEVDQVRRLTESIQNAMSATNEKTAAGSAAGEVLIQNAEQLQSLVQQVATLTGSHV